MYISSRHFWNTTNINGNVHYYGKFISQPNIYRFLNENEDTKNFKILSQGKLWNFVWKSGKSYEI